jgi:hypothetical protein
VIDPSIALSYKSPQIPDMAEGLIRGMQLKGMQQQQQMGSLELQQKQIEMQDQATMRQAYMESNGDLEQTLQRAMKSGASPKALMGLRSSMMEMQQKAANLSETQLKVQQGHGAALSSEASGLLSEPDPAKRMAAFPGSVQRLVSGGYITPQDGQKMLTSAAADPSTLSDDNLKMLVAHGMTAKDQADTALKARTVQAEADTAAARALTAKTSADKLTAELPGITAEGQQKQRVLAGTNPQGITADQQATLAGQAATRAQTASHNAVEERQGAGRLSVEQQAQALRQTQFNATLGAGLDANGQRRVGPDGKPLSGEAYLATLQPAYAAMVKAIAGGRQTQLPRGKELAWIMSAVNQYDPTFTNQRAELRKAFTTGKDGSNIGALNTATVHLDQLADVAKAMQNGNFHPGNEFFNATWRMFGNATPTNFEGLKSAVAGELANALKGNATDVEIANLSKSIDAANSPQQLAGVIDTHMHTLGAKLNTYDERYHAQMPEDKWSPVLPAAQAAFQKHGVNPLARAAAAGNAGGGRGATPAYQVGQTVTYNGAPHKIKAIKPDGKLVLEQ